MWVFRVQKKSGSGEITFRVGKLESGCNLADVGAEVTVDEDHTLVRIEKRDVHDLDTRFRVQGSWCRVQILRCRVLGAGFRVQGSEFRVQGSGFLVQGAGCRFYGSGSWGQG